MCEALRTGRKSLQALDAVAARSRHGELVFSISWVTRKRALEFAWELVARFISHLEGKSNDHWKLLDVRFEDQGAAPPCCRRYPNPSPNFTVS